MAVEENISVGGWRVLELPLASLVEWDKNPRGPLSMEVKFADLAAKEWDEEDEGKLSDDFEKGEAFEGLRRSLREHGQISPLVVTDGPEEGKYFVVAGNRRLAAARAAGLKTLVALYRPMSEDEMYRYAVADNAFRLDFPPENLGAVFRRFHDEKGWSWEKVGQYFGLPRSTVRAYVKEAEEMQRLRSRGISKKTAESMGKASYSYRVPDDKLFKAAQEADKLGGASPSQARTIARMMASGVQPEDAVRSAIQGGSGEAENRGAGEGEEAETKAEPLIKTVLVTFDPALAGEFIERRGGGKLQGQDVLRLVAEALHGVIIFGDTLPTSKRFQAIVERGREIYGDTWAVEAAKRVEEALLSLIGD